MPNKVHFTPHLVSFYRNIKLDYLDTDAHNKWFVKQVKLTQDERLDGIKAKNRRTKTSQTSASLIFYDEEQNNLFSKLPSNDQYPYGFIWNIDTNANDTCIFCQVDGRITDDDFIDTKNFEHINVKGINLYKKRNKPMFMMYRGNTENIMKFARMQTVGLAKKVYDTLRQELDLNKEITQQMLNDAIKKIEQSKFQWREIHGYTLLDDGTLTNIQFNTSTRQVNLLSNYNEIAIRRHDSCMYFNNLCVNIENMNESLKENHKNIKDNIENFKSFIDACLKTGSKDIVIFRNKKEEELANNANDKFWLKSSPLIKEKIKFLEFIDTYCEKFKQYFTEEQKQKIEELRNKKDINNVSLFGLGCYPITTEEKNNSSCGCLFW